MSWAEIFSKERKEPLKEIMKWACSSCNRKFLKIENVRCHVSRNRKCSARNAREIKLEDAFSMSLASQKNRQHRVLSELFEHKRDENIIVQRPAHPRKKRTGVRPFPAALISRIAKEGKELARNHGRRETSRLLLERYPLANLSLTSIDR